MRTTRATLADAQDISALIHKLSHHFLAASAGPETEAFLSATNAERMAQYIMEPSRVYVVARDTEGLAGFISLKDCSRISQLFVEPRHQGKGLGRRLWNEVLIEAAADEDAEFTVDSSLGAVAVYERLGFTVCGPITRQGGVVFTPMRRRGRTK